METEKWQTRKVHGRDEVLQDIEKRANAYSASVICDVRAVMHDYEVDMYRLVLSIGKRYGMDTAYEIMSDTVTEKRLKWLDQEKAVLQFSGTEIEKGWNLYQKYFKLKAEDIKIVELTTKQVVFKRKDYINAIAYACDVLSLDVIEVNNKVYARSMNFLLEKINPSLRHIFLKYQDGWYDEMIVLDTAN
jgi:hypothetical protein